MASTHHVNISGSLYIPRTKQDDGSHSHDWMGHPLRQPYNSDGGGVNSSTTTSSSREAFTLERFVQMDKNFLSIACTILAPFFAF